VLARKRVRKQDRHQLQPGNQVIRPAQLLVHRTRSQYAEHRSSGREREDNKGIVLKKSLTSSGFRFFMRIKNNFLR
jgi:hypothetical protein